jgi:hypothetical protein
MYDSHSHTFTPRLAHHTTVQNLAAETAAYLTTKHPDYAILAARIAISNLHKETKKSFSQVIEDLYKYGMLPGDVFLILNLTYSALKSTQRMASLLA